MGPPKREGLLANKVLLDDREATLYQEMFGFRILIGPVGVMGGDEYVQYRNEDLEAFSVNKFGAKILLESALNVMLTKFAEWDGYGYPSGWYRYRSGGTEYVYNTPNGKQHDSD